MWEDLSGVYQMNKTVDKKKLEDYLRTLRTEKFTGKVTINFFKGGVSNVNVGNEPAIWEEKIIKVN